MSQILAERPAIQEKAAQIAYMITRSLEMQMFRQAERALRTDKEATELLQAVQQHSEQEDEAVDNLLERLEGLDVVRHFTIAQEQLSEVVTHVTRIVAATVSDRMDIVLKTEGGGCCSDCTSCSSASECGSNSEGGCDSGLTA